MSENKHHEHHHHHHDHHAHECGCGCQLEQKEKQKQLSDCEILYVKGLDCANCAMKVEAAIANMKEVEDASLNFASEKLQIKLKTGYTLDMVFNEIKKTALQVEDGIEFFKEQKPQLSIWRKHQNEIIRLLIALVLFVFGLVIKETWLSVCAMVLALVLSGGEVLIQAVKNLMKANMFDETLLMSIATLGAFYVGEYSEGVAVLLFYSLGELLQSIAVDRSRNSITSLMELKSESATLLKDGKEVIIDPAMIQVGDILVIKPGERVSVDGILYHGESSFDTMALTGESLPRTIGEGEEILSGMVNLSNKVEMQATKVLSDSTVSRILELVENAGNRKAPVEKFITKFARVYTPVVVFGAIALVVFGMMVDPQITLNGWLYRGFTFLVVSCPCALLISIPLTLFAGIGGASKKGILVKGGNYLEALNTIDTVVFDKTGTLSKGQFALSEIIAKNMDTAKLLELAAYSEYHSNHPLARSIVAAYGKEIDSSKITQFEEISGKGIFAEVEGHTIQIGNHAYVEKLVDFIPSVREMGSVLYVVMDHEYVGYLRVSDEVKSTSAKAISTLQKLGKRCILLSGDRKETVSAFGEALHIDETFGELLPQEKVAYMEQYAADCPVAFVGDGINDAPVLVSATVGIAMGGIGSDIAIEASDIVLMKDDPYAIVEAFAIAKRTRTILWENIIFALGMKGLILILTMFGITGMWLGVFADVGVAILAVLNAMRAYRV